MSGTRPPIRFATPVLLLGALLSGLPVTVRAAAHHVCSTPTELYRLHEGLPRTEERIRRAEPVTIVAIGSSSTAGTGASSPAFTYPNQLALELRRLLPDIPFNILNKGMGGEKAGQTAARFGKDVLAENPDLVIWQVGTNDTLHDEEIALYRDTLRRGVEMLEQAGVDVLIMDLQYAPQVLAHPFYRQVEQETALLGKEEGAPVFRRFAIMHHWLTADGLSFPAIISADGLHMTDLSYSCLGQLLANAIVDRAGQSVIAQRRATEHR